MFSKVFDKIKPYNPLRKKISLAILVLGLVIAFVGSAYYSNEFIVNFRQTTIPMFAQYLIIFGLVSGLLLPLTKKSRTVCVGATAFLVSIFAVVQFWSLWDAFYAAYGLYFLLVQSLASMGIVLGAFLVIYSLRFFITQLD